MGTATDRDGTTVRDGNDDELATLSEDDMAARLVDADTDVQRLRAEYLEAVDSRDRLIFKAIDGLGMSARGVARAMGHRPSMVHHVLAKGAPPETPVEPAHPEMP